jgi:hypothetical protein
VTQLLLRWLNAPGLVLLVLVGVALQTSLFNSYPFLYLQPDVVLLAVAWMALRREFTEGGVITLILAAVAESHSAAPQGLFLIAYMSIYLLVRGASRLLVIPNLSSMVMVTMVASIGWKLIYLFVVYLLGTAANQWRHTLVLLLPGAVMAGITAIWVFRWLEKFDLLTFKDPRARQPIEDELALDGEVL